MVTSLIRDLPEFDVELAMGVEPNIGSLIS